MENEKFVTSLIIKEVKLNEYIILNIQMENNSLDIIVDVDENGENLEGSYQEGVYIYTETNIK